MSRAARPAGPPPDDDVPAVIKVGPPAEVASVTDIAAVADPFAVPAKSAAEPSAAPTTSRAARPAGPPPEVPETPATSKVGDASGREGEVEVAQEDPEAEAITTPEPKTPAKRTRSRARKAPVVEVEVETPDAEVEVTVEAPVDDEEPVKKTTRTRARRASRQAGAPEDVPSFVADPFAATLATPFSPPIDDEDEEEGPSALDVVFQPPMVVFQPPSVVAKQAPAKPVPAVPAVEEEADADEESAEAQGEDDSDDSDRPSRRRRRRGGRGRGRARDDASDDENGEEPGEAADEQAAQGEEAEEGDEEQAESDEETGASGSRRRRRRRRRTSGDDDEPQPDDPPNTVVRVRAPRVTRIEDEVQSVRGSTRLEAKKQRRREGRDAGRRRPPIVTEAEFLARREAVERVMVVRQEGERTQIGVLEDDVLVEHYVDRASHQSYVGNVYLGKVQNVLPSMEAAFVDIGKGRNAVLYAGEVNWDVAGMVGQPRRIESALKSGQPVLVQVTKDPLGHKGARLTSQISLPGRYLVYVPDGSMTGISRKLPDKERTRLKSILRKIMPENAGVIVRTAAEGASEEELVSDVTRLASQWENIQKQVKAASAPSLLHGEPDLTVRVIRDIFNEDFTKLVVAGEGVWDEVQDYVNYVAPHLADRTERWTGNGDAFSHYRIDEQLAKALERKVWLPSGGSLVIDRTEAMTVVDVNTGKFTGQGGNLEETVTRNNLESAEEIVRQLRLRDLGGIIVIDFIDMVLESNRDLVLRRLLECLARDRTKHQVAEVTSLGLVQMTRKRVGSGLLEAFSEVCECCNGRGIHVSLTPVEEKPEQTGNGNTASRKRKRKGEIERVVEAKVAKQEAVVAADAVDDDDDFVVDAAQPIADPVPAEAPKPRTRTRRTRPAGPPPEDTEDIGTVAITLETGETVRVEAVVGDPDAEIVVEEAEDMAPKRRRSRRPTRAEKIEAAKSDAPE